MSQVLVNERPQLLSQSLRRFAGVVLVLALLGGVLAAAYASTRTPSYSSTSSILLRPSTGNPYSVQTGPSSQQVTIAVTTEAALVNSEPVLKLVNNTLSPDLSPANVTASVPPNTSTILTTVRASSAAAAQRGAQAVAEGYLAYRSAVSSAARKVSVDQLNRQIATVKASLAKSSAKAAALAATAAPPDPQAARQAQLLTEQLISFQDLLNTATSIEVNPGTLVSPASPGHRTGIPTWMIVVVGALLGLLVGTALALWLGRRDRRVHARSGPVVSGVPVLAVLAEGRGDAPTEADRQAYQRLRTSVLASSALPSAVAVSGVGTRDTSSLVSLELGRSMTRAGYRVVLVLAGADETGPFTGDVRGARGLADALRGDVSILDLLVEHDGLSVVSAGSGIAQQQELLSGQRFGQIVQELKSAFDYVLIVTGPAVLPAELATARLADALLLVGQDGATSRIDIADVADRSRLVGLSVSGLVLRPRRSRWRRGGRNAEPVSESNSTDQQAQQDRKEDPVTETEQDRRASPELTHRLS